MEVRRLQNILARERIVHADRLKGNDAHDAEISAERRSQEYYSRLNRDTGKKIVNCSMGLDIDEVLVWFLFKVVFSSECKNYSSERHSA